MSNLARFVVIVWVFIILILTQSYTASLTSMLTVQQLQPTFTDVNELIKRGECVGYQNGSFILGLLKKRGGFNETKLMAYNSPEECDEAFSKGSVNNGIAAAFDEIPYVRLLLGLHCSKYAMVGPIYKTGGFGFVFPRGSLLVIDVSRAILNVTEDDVMFGMEKFWLGKQTSCSDSSASISSSSLGIKSSWGLFLITGVASISAFLIFAIIFLYEHRHLLMQFNPNPSLWRKTKLMLRRFDQKDLGSHTFRKSELQDRSVIDGITRMGAVEASRPYTNCPPSPSSEYGELSLNRAVTPQESSAVVVELSSPNIQNQEIRLGTTLEIVHENY